MERKLDFSAQTYRELYNKIVEIDRFKGKWEVIEQQQNRNLRHLRMVATVQSIGSSTRIEGSTMSDAEVETLLKNMKITELKTRDEQEVGGYYEVLNLILDDFQEIGLTASNILSLHNLLMKHSQKDERHRGKYKQLTNQVVATYPDGTQRTVFRTTEVHLVEKEMYEILEWTHAAFTAKEHHKLVIIGAFIYEFLSIHPFQDGNGRLSRLLASLLLLKNGYAWIQYISFEHEIENRKAEYYKVLMETQRNRPGENVTAWLQFFISCLNNIQRNLLQKLDQHKDPAQALSLREQRILFFIQNYPGSKSGEIAQKLDIALPTVKKTLKDLRTKNLVSKIGVGRATAYLFL